MMASNSSLIYYVYADKLEAKTMLDAGTCLFDRRDSGPHSKKGTVKGLLPEYHRPFGSGIPDMYGIPWRDEFLGRIHFPACDKSNSCHTCFCDSYAGWAAPEEDRASLDPDLPDPLPCVCAYIWHPVVKLAVRLHQYR